MVGVLAVISLGVVGAIFASGSGGRDILTPSLSSLTRLSALDVDRIMIEKGGDTLSVERKDANWTVGTHAGNAFKIDFVWDLLGQIDQAQSIPSDAEEHAVLGLTRQSGTTVSFWNDGVLVDSLIVGSFNDETGGTFMRHPSADAIAAIGLDLERLFSPEIDEWRENVIVDAAAVLVESLKFTYPNESFTVTLKIEETESDLNESADLLQQAAVNASILTGEAIPERQANEAVPNPDPIELFWVLESGGSQTRAAPDSVMEVLQQLAPLFAYEFADEEWEALSRIEADWSLEIGGAGLGSLAHLSFYGREAEDSYFVRKTGLQEIFIVDADTVEALMKRPDDLEALLDIETAP